MPYRAPVEDVRHALFRIAGFDALMGSSAWPDLDADLVSAILDEAGRFATERVALLGPAGDKTPARLADGHVTTSPGWRETYADWQAAGWNSLAGPVDHGGQGLPLALSMATQEFWNSGSMAFCLGPTLTAGAVEAIAAHGSAHLKDVYLPKLVSGEWMGTMNLTEPQAGSDVGALKARAERRDDGTYRIFGTKIFITYGEHDLTENIVHLVLARLPDAPAGTRGISLFLVPKFLVNADGSLGARNDAYCVGLEHKLGIHGSPTCTMSYGDHEGAIGWLVGEENRGLHCMFTMMNNARLAVGVQGVGVAEAASQQALHFARDRRQGRAPGETEPGMSPIVRHPDVQRMLLTSRALTMAARTLCTLCAVAIDMSHSAPEAERERWHDRVGLLTPLAKAFSTDIGFDVASLGVQVHGGMGFIEETGAARHLRDVRIAAIYEGTNGIQAMDLVMRKLPLANGAAVADLIDDCLQVLGETTGRSGFDAAAQATRDAVAHARAATVAIEGMGVHSADAAAVAVPYLRLMSLTVATSHMLAGAARAEAAGDGDAARHTAIACFLAEHLLDEAASLSARVCRAAKAVGAYAAAGLA